MRQFGPPVMRKSERKIGSKTPILLKPAAKPTPRVANKLFTEIAKITSHEVGKPWVFAIALGTVVVWALSGPYFNYSDTWQLVIQHRHDHRYVPHGFSYSEFAESGLGRDSGQAR